MLFIWIIAAGSKKEWKPNIIASVSNKVQVHRKKMNNFLRQIFWSDYSLKGSWQGASSEAGRAMEGDEQRECASDPDPHLSCSTFPHSCPPAMSYSPCTMLLSVWMMYNCPHSIHISASDVFLTYSYELSSCMASFCICYCPNLQLYFQIPAPESQG